MTYQASPVALMSDIPALVGSFAASLGFTVTTVNATTVTVKHPTYTGARVFTVKSESTGALPIVRDRIAISTDVASSTPAWAESPKFNRTNTLTDPCTPAAPTRLHLIGMRAGAAGDAGKSFIAGVIEYGFNLYRHFYLGYMEKASAFDGGELTTGSAFAPGPVTLTGANITFDNYAFTQGLVIYPFGACINAPQGAAQSNGGAYIQHANNAYPWRRFSLNPDSTNASNLDIMAPTDGVNCILGGFKDCFNTGQLTMAKSQYAGAQVLVPINLLIGKRAGSTQQFQYVGRPHGARMVHMEDLEPGAEISIGSSTWRVFPVFAKSTASSVQTMTLTPGSTNRGFPISANTSQYVGMAYQVSE